MNEAWLVPVLLLAVPTVIGVAAWINAREETRRMIASFAGDPRYEARGSGFHLEVRSRSAPSMTLIPSSTDGKNCHPTWVVTVTGLKLARRTTLEAAPESVFGLLARMVGVHDVETGVDDFDRALRLRGSDADVVRGVVARPAVRAALEALVTHEAGARLIRLDVQGRLRVETRRVDLKADEARGCLDRVRALVVALEEAADVPPVLPPFKSDVSSVSSASGAPVGFGARV